MKKLFIIPSLILVLLALTALVFDWGRRGVVDNSQEKIDFIQVIYPKPGDLVKSPLMVFGKAKNNWFLNSNLQIELRDIDGNVISKSFGVADGDLETEDFVEFTARLEYGVPENSTVSIGELVVRKSDLSGLVDNETLNIPLRFAI